MIICRWAILMVSGQDSTVVVSENSSSRVHCDRKWSVSNSCLELTLALRSHLVVSGDCDHVLGFAVSFASSFDSVVWICGILHETKVLGCVEGATNVAGVATGAAGITIEQLLL